MNNFSNKNSFLDEPEPESQSIEESLIDLNELAKYLEDNGEKSYNSKKDLANILSFITGVEFLYLITLPHLFLYFLALVLFSLTTFGYGFVVIVFIIGLIYSFEKVFIYSANESIKSVYGLVTGPQASNHIYSIMSSLHHYNYYKNLNKNINFWFYRPILDEEYSTGILIPISETKKNLSHYLLELSYDLCKKNFESDVDIKNLLLNENENENVILIKNILKNKYKDEKSILDKIKELLSDKKCNELLDINNSKVNFFNWKKIKKYINDDDTNLEESIKIKNNNLNKEYEKIESKVNFNFNLTKYKGSCLNLSIDQLKSLINHSFLNNYDYKYIFNLITKIQTKENLPNYNDSDNDNNIFQDFLYNCKSYDENIYFVTGPLFMGYLVKLNEKGEIIEYENGQGIERYKVYLKENGWFTVCDCDNDPKKFIDCNPYKFKDENQCWNLKIHTEDGNEKGFYFLNLVDAVIHDSSVSYDCYFNPIVTSEYNNIHTNFIENNKTEIDKFSEEVKDNQQFKNLKDFLEINSEQKGGSNKYYNKYMKYKHKYLELKNNLNKIE